MAQAKLGDTVRVHYEGQLTDGTVFDSSYEREPIEFVLGQEMVIPGFENAIVGMEVGDAKEVSITPAEAFGEYRDDLLIDVERAMIPGHIDPRPGMKLEIRSAEEDGPRYVTIAEVSDTTVTLDGNHPLAGKEIVMKIELVEIL